MRAGIDFAARRFVHTARLHADEAVLDQVEPADALLAAQVVERREQGRGRHRLSVKRYAVAAPEIHGDILGRIGPVLRDRTSVWSGKRGPVRVVSWCGRS